MTTLKCQEFNQDQCASENETDVAFGVQFAERCVKVKCKLHMFFWSKCTEIGIVT